MLKAKHTKKFKKDLKRYEHQKNVMLAIRVVIETLLKEEELEEKYCDHYLTGDWNRYRECHIKPDLLLIYKIDDEYLFLERLGSHSELFT